MVTIIYNNSTINVIIMNNNFRKNEINKGLGIHINSVKPKEYKQRTRIGNR